MKDETALRAEFDKMGAGEQGSLDQGQFTSLIRKLGLRMTDGKAAKAFQSLATDDDGRVVFDAFSAWWFKYDRP